VHFIHGAQSGKVHAFGKQIAALAQLHPDFKVHFCYSRPAEGDVLGKTHHAQGQMSIDTIKKLLSFGISVDRIFYQSFGPATVLKPEVQPKAPVRQTKVTDEVVPVRFRKSAAGGEWSSDRGTLLELAESLGVAPKFGCRSGICGTCTTRIVEGAVDYLEDPVAPRGAGEVLLCCSVPRSGANVVLDL
jgi:ferredoxin